MKPSEYFGEISNAISGFSHITKERYFSNKIIFSTILTIFLLNGKGILYFTFATSPEKLSIIKGFDYGLSFIIKDVLLSFFLSVLFLAFIPRVVGALNKKVFYRSEMYQKNAEVDFFIEQKESEGRFFEAEKINSREYKHDEMQLKLTKAVNDYEDICLKKESLDRRVDTLNEEVNNLNLFISKLKLENEHKTSVCDASKIAAKQYVSGASDIINKYLMHGERDGISVEKFDSILNEMNVSMGLLLDKLNDDATFEPQNINSLIKPK